jgi:hypothetical protein
MMYEMSYRMYQCQRGRNAAEQRAADDRAGAAAAEWRDLRLSLARVLRLGRRVRPARGMTDAVTGSARVLSGIR